MMEKKIIIQLTLLIHFKELKRVKIRLMAFQNKRHLILFSTVLKVYYVVPGAQNDSICGGYWDY